MRNYLQAVTLMWVEVTVMIVVVGLSLVASRNGKNILVGK